jgi:capsular exopolysaccharide synthesis family protein
MQFTRYWQTIQRWAWLIITFAVVASATAGVYSLQLPKVYQTRTVVLVNPAQIVLPASAYLGVDELVQTYAQLINTYPVRQELIDNGVPRTQGQLAGALKVARESNTTLIDITIDDSSPAVAQLIAQGIIPAFNASLEQLQNQFQKAASGQRLEALVPWEVPVVPPTAPTRPNPPANAGLALVAGLVVGFALAFLLEFLDNTVKSETDVSIGLGLPLLGMVLNRRGRGQRIAPLSGPGSGDQMTESYRAIRTNIHFGMLDRNMRSIVVTSTVPGEGKTSTACNLAVVMAQAGNRVILVDADFRRPEVHRVFKKEQEEGLGNLILGDRPLQELAIPSGVPNLRLVCAGPPPPNPSELLGSRAMLRVVQQLTGDADIVIFDTPPIGAVTDATVLAGRTDAVVMVVERGRASIPSIRRSKETLQGLRATILGVVLNKVRGSEADSYYYYYYRYSGGTKPAKSGGRGNARPSPRPKLPVPDGAIVAAGRGSETAASESTPTETGSR